MADKIDYDGLKKRGFLRQRQEGYFLLRTRMSAGHYTAGQIEKTADIAKRFGRGIVHGTTRQGLEIPFIRFEDIDKVEREADAAGLRAGTSGPRLRATTFCPGKSWCKSGLVDTSALFERIEGDLGIRCAMDLPHKFKIVISGCPNRCTRAEASEIGIHGQVDTSAEERRIGYAVYLGGCGGRTPRLGFKLDKVFSEDEVLVIIDKVVKFYKANAKPRQRLALLIEEIGKEEFLKRTDLR
jgi:dissimilatory sulfite reductase (desulfoviridin) alpha/beta subunit